jgi:hypothetical protein
MLRQCYHGFEPEFRLAIGRLHMNMHPRFFPREEVEPELA